VSFHFSSMTRETKEEEVSGQSEQWHCVEEWIKN
jgi:hypothetical protein